MSVSLQPHGLPLTRLSCPSLSPWVCSNSCLLSWWCHPTVSSSVTHLSSYLQSFPASESFPMSQLFTSGSRSIGTSASVLPVNIQGWFSLGLTDLISLLSKGLSGVFSSTTVWKHQFFSAQTFQWSNSHVVVTSLSALTGELLQKEIARGMSSVWSSHLGAFDNNNNPPFWNILLPRILGQHTS